MADRVERGRLVETVAAIAVSSLLVLVGLVIEGRPGCVEGRLRFEPRVCTELAPHPFRGAFAGELREGAGSGYVDDPGDSRYWYWSGATVLLLGAGWAAATRGARG